MSNRQDECLDGGGAEPFRWIHWSAVVLIFALGLAARTFHTRPDSATYGSDDQRYILCSREMFDGQPPTFSPAYSQRSVWNGMGYLFHRAYGLTTQSAYVLLIAYYALAAAGMLWTLRPLVSPWAAVIGYAFLLLHPLMVKYDSVYWPETLGVALSTVMFGAVLRYSKRQALGWLALAAFLLGLSYGIKQYFVLPFMPLGLSLVWYQRNDRKRLMAACGVAIGMFVVGMAIKTVIVRLDGQTAQGALSAMTVYGQRMGEVAASPIVKQLLQRVRYPFWILTTCGGLFGIATLCSLYYLARSGGRGFFGAFVGGTTFLYIGFLALFPASVSPWIFVEMVPRYLPIVMPPLAIGVGLAAHEWLRRSAWPSPAQTAALVILGFAVAGFTVADSAEAYPAYMQNEFVAIRQMLRRAPDWEITEIWFPPGYENRLPDHFYQIPGVQVKLARDVDDLQQRGERGAIYVPDDLARYLLSADPRRALPPPNLGVDKDRHDRFLRAMDQQIRDGVYQVVLISTARGSTRYWADKAGVSIGGSDEIVGVLLVPSSRG
ncbi:MAG: hypothetical protein U0795_01150 [Pirellulales bacterium]